MTGLPGCGKESTSCLEYPVVIESKEELKEWRGHIKRIQEPARRDFHRPSQGQFERQSSNTNDSSVNKIRIHGLPWWRSGWESACQCRGHGFEPWSGRIPHAAEQLSPWATATEPARLEPVLCNKRGRDSERPAHRDEEWPPLSATRESPRTETKTQHSEK